MGKMINRFEIGKTYIENSNDKTALWLFIGEYIPYSSIVSVNKFIKVISRFGDYNKYTADEHTGMRISSDSEFINNIVECSVTSYIEKFINKDNYNCFVAMHKLIQENYNSDIIDSFIALNSDLDLIPKEIVSKKVSYSGSFRTYEEILDYAKSIGAYGKYLVFGYVKKVFLHLTNEAVIESEENGHIGFALFADYDTYGTLGSYTYTMTMQKIYSSFNVVDEEYVIDFLKNAQTPSDIRCEDIYYNRIMRKVYDGYYICRECGSLHREVKQHTVYDKDMEYIKTKDICNECYMTIYRECPHCVEEKNDRTRTSTKHMEYVANEDNDMIYICKEHHKKLYILCSNCHDYSLA
ncbi:MAG: hypothetical protein ACRC5M_00085, partial [Anaeroplasmataceae bacterium]